MNFEIENIEALLKLRDTVNVELDKRLKNYEGIYNKMKEAFNNVSSSSTSITSSTISSASITPSSVPKEEYEDEFEEMRKNFIKETASLSKEDKLRALETMKSGAFGILGEVMEEFDEEKEDYKIRTVLLGKSNGNFTRSGKLTEMAPKNRIVKFTHFNDTKDIILNHVNSYPTKWIVLMGTEKNPNEELYVCFKEEVMAVVISGLTAIADKPITVSRVI